MIVLPNWRDVVTQDYLLDSISLQPFFFQITNWEEWLRTNELVVEERFATLIKYFPNIGHILAPSFKFLLKYISNPCELRDC